MIYILTAVILVLHLLPFVRSDFWTFRVMEYPRLQKFVLTAGLITWWSFIGEKTWYDWALVTALSILLLNLVRLILPFTILSKKKVPDSRQKDAKSIKIMISNVYEPNDDYAGCLRVVQKYDPDVLLLLEVDNKWDQGLSALDQRYSFTVKQLQDNQYGMSLYSRLPLIDAKIQFLVDQEIPSIESDVLWEKELIKLYCLHPTPPSPTENAWSTDRNKELIKVAEQARKCLKPVLVIGDLNDVAWSGTTKEFLKLSTLRDPREGRGFFNTFDAKNVFMRFPLDHAFVSEQFSLISIKRLRNFGSDHFPMLIELDCKNNGHKGTNESKM